MDHERVNIHTTSMSCGVLELNRISDDAYGVLYAIGSRLYHPSRGDPAAFIVFSDIDPKLVETDTTSNRLVQAIRNAGVGDVTVSIPAENPKTGNIIRVYVWCINHEKFKDWYAKKRVDKMRKVGA